MVYLCTDAKRFREILRPDRHNHELLKIDSVRRMLPAIQDIHHRHGKELCPDSAEIAVERHIQRCRRCLCTRHRDRQRRICAEIFLALRAVQLHELPVDCDLIQCITAVQRRGNLLIDILHRVLHPESEISRLTVPQLHRLEASRAGSRRHSRKPRVKSSVIRIFYRDLRLHCGISSGIQNFSRVYFCNFKICRHKIPPFQNTPLGSISEGNVVYSEYVALSFTAPSKHKTDCTIAASLRGTTA